MKISTKSQYAVTAMLDIALNQNQGSVSLSAISERQGISISYLEQLFAKLRKQKLVTSTRGPGGGYHLGRDTSEIFVAEIIDAVNDKSKIQDDRSASAAYQLWSGLSNQIHTFLCDISLADLLE